MKNYGLNVEREEKEQSLEDYPLGAVKEGSMVSIPSHQREIYFPVGELQAAKEDTQSCASFAPVNILECYFNYMLANKMLTSGEVAWLTKNGYIVDGKVLFSNAFVAINSGTTRAGNSLKAPLQAIHSQGLIPKQMLPMESWMTWEDFHNPKRITKQMRALGLDLLDRFRINYEKVFDLSLDEMFDVGGHAWPKQVDGIYPKTDRGFNHAFVKLSPVIRVGDTYPDSFDGDYFKTLAPDYKFLSYGYRILINRETKPRKRKSPLATWLSGLFNL